MLRQHLSRRMWLLGQLAICAIRRTGSQLRTEGILGQLGRLLWPVNSQYPHPKNGLRYISRTSLRLPPLGCILRNWKKIDPESLKKKRLVVFCNETWSWYELGNQEKWTLKLQHNPPTWFLLSFLMLKPYDTRSESESEGLTLPVSFYCHPIPSTLLLSPSPSSLWPRTFSCNQKPEKTLLNILKNPLLTSLSLREVEG